MTDHDELRVIAQRALNLWGGGGHPKFQVAMRDMNRIVGAIQDVRDTCPVYNGYDDCTCGEHCQPQVVESCPACDDDGGLCAVCKPTEHTAAYQALRAQRDRYEAALREIAEWGDNRRCVGNFSSCPCHRCLATWALKGGEQ